MDNKFGFEVAGADHNCLTGWEFLNFGDDFFALLEYCGAPGSVYGAIYSTAAHKRGIGGVDDGIGGLVGNIILL
jgi:hypothetical protein